MHALATHAAAAALAALLALGLTRSPSTPEPDPKPMHLGAFSVSLAVKDLAAARAFYEKLGFTQMAGNAAQNWLILQNGTTTIGLFHGMFDKNCLTFNPGWSQKAEPLKEFEDVREIQERLEARGLVLATRADESSTGPAHFTLLDPDGNPILFDQHVPKPGR
jgi:catechol 2,3-dioxygenase-like lactoylglutathione lyase family enzyme